MNPRWTLARAYTRIAPLHRGGYRIARWARAGFPRDQWKRRVDCLPGVTLDLDLGTYPDVSMATGIYELETRRWIRRLLPVGGHFVDCGANLGYFSVYAARCVGPAGRVDAVEPDPVNRDRLAAHLKLNDITNVTIHPVAVGTEKKRLTLYHPTGQMNHGQASGFAGLVPGGRAFEVAADRLDAVVPDVPNLVKFDVEGAEFDAIRGAEQYWTSPNPPAVIVEHNTESSAAAGFKGSDLLRWITGVQPRYDVFWIDWRLMRIADPAGLDRQPRQGNLLLRAKK
jgi:FkbM family methyltransferase